MTETNATRAAGSSAPACSPNGCCVGLGTLPCGDKGLIAEREPSASADLIVFAYCPLCGRKLEANSPIRVKTHSGNGQE